MHRNFTAMETRTDPLVMAHPFGYAQPLLMPQNDVLAIIKKRQDRWFARTDNQQRNNFSETPYPSPPMSSEGSHSSRLHGANTFPKTPYPAPSTTIRESERDITDITTAPSLSATTAITLVNGTPHPHPHPHPHPNRSSSHVHEPNPTPAPTFSIRQTSSAYRNINLSEESLNRQRNYYNMSNMAQEVHYIIPESGSSAVRLQNPVNLPQRRLSERTRKHQKLDFFKTVLVHEYEQGYKDMPTRPVSTKFHDDGESEHTGSWPRNWFTRLHNELDSIYWEQTYDIGRDRFRYDSVKENYVWTTLEEAKDLSGREERMREKAKSRREERLREEADAREGEGEGGAGGAVEGRAVEGRAVEGGSGSGRGLNGLY